MPTQTQLAIVIPYYKVAFFHSLLEALESQTNKNFNLYIGDDHSPEPPDHILRLYYDHLNITYHRFDNRLGHDNLVKHWNRCIEMTSEEQWIWVLPDDDLPSKNCVEEFYAALNENMRSNISVFRFLVNIIDQDEKVLKRELHAPEFQNNYQFYLRHLRGENNGISLGENIFEAKVLKDLGGFFELPKAWCSDHATVLLTASKHTIYTINRASFSFRFSLEGISSSTKYMNEKMRARIQFSKWLLGNGHIFPANPEPQFYRLLYFKSEYYVINEWKPSLKMLLNLYSLRRLCFGSVNPLPLLKLYYSYLIGKIRS